MDHFYKPMTLNTSTQPSSAVSLDLQDDRIMLNGNLKVIVYLQVKEQTAYSLLPSLEAGKPERQV